MRGRAEAVLYLSGDAVYFAVVGEGVQHLVEADLFGRNVYVIVRDEGGLVGFDGAVLNEETVPELGYSGFDAKFLHGLGKDFLIGFVAHVGDEAALFGPKEVAGAADVEVLHGNVEAAAKV